MNDKKPLDENKKYDKSVQPSLLDKIFGILFLIFRFGRR